MKTRGIKTVNARELIGLKTRAPRHKTVQETPNKLATGSCGSSSKVLGKHDKPIRTSKRTSGNEYLSPAKRPRRGKLNMDSCQEKEVHDVTGNKSEKNKQETLLSYESKDSGKIKAGSVTSMKTRGRPRKRNEYEAISKVNLAITEIQSEETCQRKQPTTMELVTASINKEAAPTTCEKSNLVPKRNNSVRTACSVEIVCPKPDKCTSNNIYGKDVFSRVLVTVCLEAFGQVGQQQNGSLHAKLQEVMAGTGVVCCSREPDFVLEGQWSNLVEARERLIQLQGASNENVSTDEFSSNESAKNLKSVRVTNSDSETEAKEDTDSDTYVVPSANNFNDHIKTQTKNIAEEEMSKRYILNMKTRNVVEANSDGDLPEHSDYNCQEYTDKKASNTVSKCSEHDDLSKSIKQKSPIKHGGLQLLMKALTEDIEKVGKPKLPIPPKALFNVSDDEGSKIIPKQERNKHDDDQSETEQKVPVPRQLSREQTVQEVKGSTKDSDLQLDVSDDKDNKIISMWERHEDQTETERKVPVPIQISREQTVQAVKSSTKESDPQLDIKIPLHQIRTGMKTVEHQKFQCEFCPSSFKTKQQKYSHKQKEHKVLIAGKGDIKLIGLSSKAAKQEKLIKDVHKIHWHLELLPVAKTESNPIITDQPASHQNEMDDSCIVSVIADPAISIETKRVTENEEQTCSEVLHGAGLRDRDSKDELFCNLKVDEKYSAGQLPEKSLDGKSNSNKCSEISIMDLRFDSSVSNMIIHPKEFLLGCKLCHSKHPCLDMFFNHACSSEEFAGEKNLPAKLICPQCGFSRENSRPWTFLAHFKKHTRAAVYQCITCQYASESKARTASHVMNAHGKRSFSCDLCEKAFTSSSLLNHHKATVHLKKEPKHLCHKCGGLFITSLALSRHKFRCRGPKLDERTAQYPNLSRMEDDLFHCPVCDWKHTARNEVWRHMRRRHREAITTYKCEHCGLFLANEITYKAHVKAQHLDPEKVALKVQKSEVQYQCYLCGKTSNSSYNLKKHIGRVHEKQVHYYCDICGKGFFQHNRMVEHKRRHLSKEEQLKIASFSCKFCRKVFTSKPYRNMHEQMNHIRETAQRYKCNKCNRSFPRPSMLEQHAVSHGFSKPSMCNRCGKTFPHPYHVRKHMRKIHHEIVQPSLRPDLPSALKEISRGPNDSRDCTVTASEDAKWQEKYQSAAARDAPSVESQDETIQGLVSIVDGSTVMTNTDTEDLMTVVQVVSAKEVQELAGSMSADGGTGPLVLEIDPNQLMQQVHVETIEGDIVLQTVEEVPADLAVQNNADDGVIMTAEIEVNEEHGSDQMYWCEHCNLLFSTLAEAETHVSSHHLHHDEAIENTKVSPDN